MPLYAASSCRTVTVIAEHRQAPAEEVAAGVHLHAGEVRAALRAAGYELDSVPAGHDLHVEVPDIVADRFERWIEG